MARQYEKMDCFEDTVKGQVLHVVDIPMYANGAGDVDRVVVFGNPQTKRVVWVPYNSEVSIDCVRYKVLRGKLKNHKWNVGKFGWFDSARGYTSDQDIECLVNLEGKVHSIKDFECRDVYVSKVANSTLNKFLIYMYDKRNNKL